MISRFIVHQHKAGRAHFDLRLVQENVLRSWSLLKEPPSRRGEQRLAIERENFSPNDMHRMSFKEDAFGEGRVYVWDEGEVDISSASLQRLSLIFRGKKLSGKYEMRHMSWYPGNRWLLRKEDRDLT
jgi:bifunctional non-homologous end joining protein LigD